jgi:hypothetical protein
MIKRLSALELAEHLLRVEVVREENGGTAMQVMLLFECP